MAPAGDPAWSLDHRVTELDNPAEAAPRFADAVAEFDVWFKAKVLAVTGVDLNATPLGPPTVEVFGWAEAEPRA